MNQSIKCESCGANLKIDQINRLRKCPYCKSVIKIPETKYDHEKYIANLNADVKKNEIQAKAKENKMLIFILIGCFVLLFLVSYVFPLIK